MTGLMFMLTCVFTEHRSHFIVVCLFVLFYFVDHLGFDNIGKGQFDLLWLQTCTPILHVYA